LLHYGELTIAEIKDYLSANQISVRSLSKWSIYRT
jgi:imidazole glycerol phosphate synthase subunit HisF